MEHNEIYNVAPTGEPTQLHSADAIRDAAKNGTTLFLDLGHDGRIECRKAAVVRGWCTAVLPNGCIVQDWAGSFHLSR